MERFVKGDIVVIPFPFSDLTEAKRRPALVVAKLDENDLILCQTTSQLFRDRYAIPIQEVDFEDGDLNKASNVRPNRIFTVDSKITLYRVGHLKSDKLNLIIKGIIDILIA